MAHSAKPRMIRSHAGSRRLLTTSFLLACGCMFALACGDPPPSNDTDAAAAPPPLADGGGFKDAEVANGTTCTVGTDCASGNCVAGVCCNTACGPVANGTSQCTVASGGVCTLSCLAGFGNCDGLYANGCEVS